MKKLTHHLSHYMPLFGILVVGIYGILYFQFDKSFQKAIIFATTFAYLFWGIAHHTIHRDLTIVIFFEYLGISILAVVILLSLV